MDPLLVALACWSGLALLLAPYLNRESPIVRHLLVAFSTIVVVRYCIWRTLVTLPELDGSPRSLAAYAFFALEMTATYQAIKDFYWYRRTVDRSAEADRQLDWYGASPPRVDVLIPTYNEPWEVLEKTLTGAFSQNYPHYVVWVLDDGRRPWLRKKVEELGAGYLTRDDNRHYKAGNLNSGLVQLRARGIKLEFLAMLDADFVARPEFLRRTMALMQTPDTGIVQTPQCFYNPDPLQRAFGGVAGWPDEQRSWFDKTLSTLDASNAATCCGTSCLVRVAALEAIGDFPTESVCEDTLSSLKMRQKGWHTRYLCERLTVGLAPEGLEEFLTQRARWMLGGVQNTRFWGPGRGIRGHLLYWLALWKMAIFGCMRFAWAGAAVLFWFTGVWLIDMPTDQMMLFFVPLWIDRAMQGWMFAGRRNLFVSDVQWLLMAPLWIKVIFQAVLSRSKTSFKVTDKALRRDRIVVHWRTLRWMLLVGGSLLLGMLYTLSDPRAPAHLEGLLQVNMLASIYFFFLTMAAAAPTIELPRRRSNDRYPTSELVYATIAGKRRAFRCRDISLGGVVLYADLAEPLPSSLVLDVSDVGDVRARPVRRPGPGLIAFAFESPELRPALIRKLYCAEGYIPSPTRWSVHEAFATFFAWPFKLASYGVRALLRPREREYGEAYVPAPRGGE
jgi:cellulose synthase (UDP-forming)